MVDPVIGYVSDEMDVALPNVWLEFWGGKTRLATASGPSGAVEATLPPGSYEVILSKAGHSTKRTGAIVPADYPLRFRMLSNALVGYAWPKWVRAGDDSELRINTAEGFDLSLWRYGWERQHILDIGRFDNHPPGALRQILPDGDFTTTGARWSEIGYSFPNTDPRLFVKAPEHSGLYYFHAKTRRSATFYSFPWIVAPREPSASIALLASNINWNAYNDYGGRSNYVAAHRLPDTPTVNCRQEHVWFTDPEQPPWDFEEYDPLSFDRPEPLNMVEEHERITDPIERRGGEHVAPAEWRLLGWMEREGFQFDYYAETHLHEGLLDLDRYRVLVLSTHPEYWSRQMYDRVKEWVFDRGGKLIYLGGNGIHCEVNFLDRSTMRVLNGRYDARTSGFDSRFARTHESEARLLGVTTTFAGYETGAPYRVLDDKHWAFEGTGLSQGDLFGTNSLDRRAVGGASGHETDKRSSQSPTGLRMLAKGTNPEGGGGEMVHFETGSGGEVFSVGSISYTCSIVVDDLVSKITGNVLRHFLR